MKWGILCKISTPVSERMKLLKYPDKLQILPSFPGNGEFSSVEILDPLSNQWVTGN